MAPRLGTKLGLGGALIAGLLIGACLERTQPAVATADGSPNSVTHGAAASVQMVPRSFADLAETVKPAVVNISTTKMVQRGYRGFDPEQLPEHLREFFRFFAPPGGGPGEPEGPDEEAPSRKQAHSLGSGFVIDPEGYVVTNNHVVEGADEIQISLADGRDLPAEVIGTDADTDLALIKVESDAGELPYLEFGDSEAARVGEWILAVGNPFGLNHTFTAGIISAKGRVIGRNVRYQDFIQTDASINPGNSGGPIIGMDGQVLGVSTAIFSRTGQSAGIGFAIPANLARFVVDQLKEKQRVSRGYLGVLIQGVDEGIAASLGLEDARGAMVSEVYEDSPAGKAGIQVGDLILAFNGQQIGDFQELPLVVSTTPPGSEVGVTILRDGERKQLRLTLAELPDERGGTAEEPQQEAPPAADDATVLGITVRPLTNEEQAQLGVNQGLMIETIDQDSAAVAAGLRPGDAIVRAGNQAIATPAELEAAVEAARDEGKEAVLLYVNRDGNNRFVGIDLE